MPSLFERVPGIPDAARLAGDALDRVTHPFHSAGQLAA